MPLQAPTLEDGEQAYGAAVRALAAWTARRAAWMDQALTAVLTEASAAAPGAPQPSASDAELEAVYRAAAACADTVALRAVAPPATGAAPDDGGVRVASSSSQQGAAP